MGVRVPAAAARRVVLLAELRLALGSGGALPGTVNEMGYVYVPAGNSFHPKEGSGGRISSSSSSSKAVAGGGLDLDRTARERERRSSAPRVSSWSCEWACSTFGDFWRQEEKRCGTGRWGRWKEREWEWE